LNHAGFKLNKALDIQLTNMFQDGKFAIFPKADCCDHAAMLFSLHSLVHIDIFCDASPPHIPFSNCQNENEHEHVFWNLDLFYRCEAFGNRAFHHIELVTRNRA